MPAQIDTKHFSGFMNTDDSLVNIGDSHHRIAWNGRFRGSGNSLRFENVEGTTLLNNPYLQDGYNETIGAYYDEKNQKIFSFVYNSKGNHGIFQYELTTGFWTKVILVGYNTVGDILNFDLSNPIYAVKILYGDDTQGDGLHWNNCQKEPCQVNIQRAISGGYGSIKRSFINVIKRPASIPISAVYENNSNITVNNLRKKLFKFKTRYVSYNFEKSVTSSQSVEPIPNDYLDSDIEKDPTKNSRITLVIPTGDSNVTDIELLGAASGKDSGDGNVLPNQFGDYFLIATLNKSELAIPDNDIYIYRFHNDQVYFPIDVEESIQEYDYVPLKALALEFLNGNVPIYGGITEGYNKTLISGAVNSLFIPEQTTHHPYIFQVSQSGDSGFGSGNIHVICVGKISVGDSVTIITTNETFTYTAILANSGDIIGGLLALAFSAGFTIVASDSQNLIISKSGESLLRFNTTPILIPVSDSFVYDTNSWYDYAIVYFDEDGRTIGAETSSGLNVQTINYIEVSGARQIPLIELSISNRPPTNAKYYQIVRSKNLSKERKIEWISDRTYKDDKYAYISIESLNVFIEQNPSSKHLVFEPIPNDRIRFYKVLSGSVNTIYTAQDFEILSQEFNPTINGAIYKGQFLKIALPTTSGTFNFGTDDFLNYFIELYSPARPASEGAQKYYEFSERYAIGNPGTSLAFHQGMLQNQSEDLSQNATFEFTQGDYYYRNRTINTGNELSYNLTPQTLQPSYRVPHSLVNQTIPSANYTAADSVSFGDFINSFSSPGWTIKCDTGPITFNITGTINIRAATTTVQEFRIQYYVLSGAGTTLYELAEQTGITAGDNVIFQVNQTMVMPSNSKAFLVMNCGDNSLRIDLISGNLKFTESSKQYTIGIIDPNFSDYFESKVNSNGRVWAVDPNAAQVFNPTLMRWGLAFQPNTNISQANRFKGLNFNEADRSRGKLQVFKTWGSRLRIFFERGVAVTGIYAKFLQTGDGNSVVSTTDEIITKNNFEFYDGYFGVGNHPEGLISAKGMDKFIDPVRGYEVRIGDNGSSMIPISEKYKGQFYIQPLFIPYNDNYIKANGGVAKILGAYNYFEEEWVTVLEGGVYNGKSIEPNTYSFNEKRNAYCSFFDFHPELIISGQDQIFSFLNGQMYIHNNTNKYCNFYNKQYYPSVTIPFNDKKIYKKTYLSLGYQSNKLWVSPKEGDIITTATDNSGGRAQVSKLKDSNFSIIESERVASFKRDINSRPDKRYAWHNGDYLKGNAIEIKLTYFGSDFTFLYLPYVKWIISQPNL